MKRNSLVIWTVLISAIFWGTIRTAVGWVPPVASVLIQEQGAIKLPQRAPIKVGANVQESKLIYKIEPAYPEDAKAAGVTGKVILAVTINEEGLVSDVKVVSGHPILADAII